MSDTTDITDVTAVPVSDDDIRKAWVTPTIEELPISATQGTNSGSGTDNLIYT